MANQLNVNASLSITVDATEKRRTGIIGTIGPVTNSVEALKDLFTAGQSIVRMNFSHGSHEYHGSVVNNAREAAKQLGQNIAIALDTKGPEIRTGDMADGGEVTLQADSTVRLVTKEEFRAQCTAEQIFVDYANMPKVMKVGGFVFIDDGLIRLEVTALGDDYLDCRVCNTAVVSSRKGVNLPNVEVDLPAVTPKDKADLLFGVEQGVDMVFASFIRKAADVHEIREVLGEKGKNILIISKIENAEGVENFDSILEATDGVMVARGDLGIEIPAEKVFLAQKMMISKCNMVGKPVICATQMLESMRKAPRPTRAEVSDVANAVLDGADCVMLSGETASGKYPVESVQMMGKISEEAERILSYHQLFLAIKALKEDGVAVEETVASSAVNAAFEQKARAIVALTNTGNTARLIAKYCPACPIFAVTATPQTARQLRLHRGVFPVLFEKNADGSKKSHAERIQLAVKAAKDQGMVSEGDYFIAVHADELTKGYANQVRVLRA